MLHQQWIAACVKRGIFLTSHHNHFINASLTHEDIKKSIEIAEDAFNALRHHSTPLSSNYHL
jgi:glutamate-1-semialdehyde 2,1-aminomutase